MIKYGEVRKPEENNYHNPEIYLNIMSKYNSKPEKCLVFEDSLVGAMAAKNAGIDVCIIYDEYSDGDRTEINRLADYTVSNFKELYYEFRRKE